MEVSTGSLGPLGSSSVRMSGEVRQLVEDTAAFCKECGMVHTPDTFTGELPFQEQWHTYLSIAQNIKNVIF